MTDRTHIPARIATLLASAAIFAGALLFASSAFAQAPTGSVTITGPATVSSNTNLAYAINYDLTGTGVSNAKFTVLLPVGVSVSSTDAPAGVADSCTGSYSSSGVTCTFTLNFTSGGVSGQASIAAQLRNGFQLDGATMTATATLTADYDGGGSSMTPVVDTADTVVTANANLSVSTIDIVNARWLVNPSPAPGDDAVGLSWEYKIRASNNGNAPIQPGWTLVDQIDPSLTFVSWREEFSGSMTEVSAPAPWTVGDLTLSGTQAIVGAYREVYVRVWISCSDLAVVPGDLTQVVSMEGDEIKASGTVQHSDDETSTAMPDAALGVCGEGGVAGKNSYPDNSVGEGENLRWSLSARPPNGAVEVADAVIIDRVDPGTTFVSATAGAPADFTVYYCAVPAETGNFTRAQFLSTYRTAGCATTAPGDLSTVTHVVWHAPTWGDAAVGIDNFSASFTVHVPFDVYADQAVIPNTARMEGAYQYGGTTTFLFEPADSVRVRTIGSPSLEISQQPFSLNSQSRNPGDEFVINVWTGSFFGQARVKNPVATFTLPPEVQLVTALAPNFSGSGYCAWDGVVPTTFSSSPTVETLGDGSTKLTWTFGDGANPERLAYDCGSKGISSYAGGKPLWLPVRVRINPFAGLTNGEMLTFAATITGENVVTPREASRTITISVPAEMRTNVEPDCTADAEPLPSLLVTYENSGGVELTDVRVQIAIPKLGDGSGTEVDTTFVRTENVPAGGAIEYRVGGTWQGTAPANLALVTDVRLVSASLGPVTGVQSFNVVVSVPGGTPTGTYIRGSSLMSADPLSEVASADSAPIKVNLCPGVLAVHVFFDGNNNGVQDSGEPDLPGYDLVTTDQNDDNVELNWTTNATGDYSQQLAPSTYEIVVTHPTAGPGATWTSNPGSGTVVTGQTVLVNIPVTCECAPQDACTTGSCDANGQCTYVSGGDGGAADDATCDGVDDDCDGDVDEDYASVDTDCGEGFCAATGTTSCVNGAVVDSCEPGDPQPGVDGCDGVDSDCNGTVDDGFTGTTVSCGTGVCAATATTICVDGVELDDCTPGDPTGEICDGEDGDCDGQIDVTAGGEDVCDVTPPGGIPITGPEGGLLCVQHPLNGEESYVTTGYTNISTQVRFCHRYDGVDATTPFPDAEGCVYEGTQAK